MKNDFLVHEDFHNKVGSSCDMETLVEFFLKVTDYWYQGDGILGKNTNSLKGKKNNVRKLLNKILKEYCKTGEIKDFAHKGHRNGCDCGIKLSATEIIYLTGKLSNEWVGEGKIFVLNKQKQIKSKYRSITAPFKQTCFE